MTDTDLRSELMELLKRASAAHHAAYRETDGADPDWPLWYAGYLHEPVNALLNAQFTKSELVYVIVGLDKALQETAPGAEWTAFWADSLINHYA